MLIPGDEFRNRARTYLVNGLERGVPSLFVDVKGVYVEAAKMEIVGEILEETIAALEKDASLHNDGKLSRTTRPLILNFRHHCPSYNTTLGVLLPCPPPLSPFPP
jgi:hypothetical protein